MPLLESIAIRNSVERNQMRAEISEKWPEMGARQQQNPADGIELFLRGNLGVIFVWQITVAIM